MYMIFEECFVLQCRYLSYRVRIKQTASWEVDAAAKKETVRRTILEIL